jgi:Propionyl-coenzyme A carboxylase BT domain
MKQLVIRLVMIAAAVATMSGIGGAQADKVDLTGKWLFSVQTDAGGGSPTFTLKQDGEKLTGHYVGTFGEADVTGTVKGKEFTIQYSADAQGQKLDITYKGTVESKDSVKGTLTIAGLGEGTFTGKRQ